MFAHVKTSGFSYLRLSLMLVSIQSRGGRTCQWLGVEKIRLIINPRLLAALLSAYTTMVVTTFVCSLILSCPMTFRGDNRLQLDLILISNLHHGPDTKKQSLFDVSYSFLPLFFELDTISPVSTMVGVSPLRRASRVTQSRQQRRQIWIQLQRTTVIELFWQAGPP